SSHPSTTAPPSRPLHDALPISGQIATQLNSLQASFQIFFNGVPATVAYAGLAPGAVGSYQFNVVVPDGVLRPEQSADNQVMLTRSEEHTSELQSPDHLVCRPLL